MLGVVNERSWSEVGVFALGAILGLAIFSRVLERILDRHHDPVLAVLIGLMVGSFRILWPWPNGLGDENGVGATVLGAPAGDVVWPIVLALLAAAGVVGFTRWVEGRA